LRADIPCLRLLHYANVVLYGIFECSYLSTGLLLLSAFWPDVSLDPVPGWCFPRFSGLALWLVLHSASAVFRQLTSNLLSAFSCLIRVPKFGLGTMALPSFFGFPVCKNSCILFNLCREFTNGEHARILCSSSARGKLTVLLSGFPIRDLRSCWSLVLVCHTTLMHLSLSKLVWALPQCIALASRNSNILVPHCPIALALVLAMPSRCLSFWYPARYYLCVRLCA
jgi:hypothetical protein